MKRVILLLVLSAGCRTTPDQYELMEVCHDKTKDQTMPTVHERKAYVGLHVRHLPTKGLPRGLVGAEGRDASLQDLRIPHQHKGLPRVHRNKEHAIQITQG